MATERNGAGELLLAGVSLEALAVQFGTPLYVYDLGAIVAEAAAIRAAFGANPHLIAYAVKANTAGPIIRALANEGVGADVVSAAELEVALESGVPPERILYSGVAKTDDEIRFALGVSEHGIAALHIESVEEVDRVAAIAQSMGRTARVGLRINPEIESVGTHDHIATGHDEAKFGVALADVPIALDRIRRASSLDLGGLTVHVGSQLVATTSYRAGARRLFEIARTLPERGKLRFLDTGGGFGIDYGDGCDAKPADFIRAALGERKAAGLEHIPLYVEPGRRLVAAHGVLVARVIQRKRALPRSWLFIDAGMNDLIRPALYQARHRVVACTRARDSTVEHTRVAGPVCESSDDFGEHFLEADAPFVALLDAGAYGFTMASEYNGRALPAEVFLGPGGAVESFARGSVAAWVARRTGQAKA